MRVTETAGGKSVSGGQERNAARENRCVLEKRAALRIESRGYGSGTQTGGQICDIFNPSHGLDCKVSEEGRYQPEAGCGDQAAAQGHARDGAA